MKILVTGSNGLLGQTLVTKLSARKDISLIAASLHDSLIPAGRFSFEQMDICDLSSVESVFKHHAPEAVIHTAAMTQVDFCEENQAKCLRVNVEGTENILYAAGKVKAHVIHLSTDFIFDGTRGPYREEDPPAPVNFYGKSKVLAEEKVRACQTSWAILRTILVYGSARPNFVHWVVRSLRKGETLRVVSDQLRMPTWNEDLAEACLHAATHHKTGIYHVSGADRVSIFDFATITAEIFNLDTSLLFPIQSRELRQPAMRPLKTGFILEKSNRELAYRPHPLREALEIIQKNGDFS